MNNIEIFPSKIEDIDEILKISALSFPVSWSRESFTKELVDNSYARYVTAKIGNVIIGFGGIWIIIDEAHVTNIAVHPEYRGIGVGSKIMEALLQICKLEYVGAMTLEVRKSNSTAQNLYEKYGFIEEGIRKKYYNDNQEDAIIMWKHNII